MVKMAWLFFSKQKTAYEMRISDWSSDVCSSDLLHQEVQDGAPTERGLEGVFVAIVDRGFELLHALLPGEAVRCRLIHAGIRGKNAPGGFIRVVILGSVAAQCGTADAALARTIGTGEHGDARDRKSTRLNSSH